MLLVADETHYNVFVMGTTSECGQPPPRISVMSSLDAVPEREFQNYPTGSWSSRPVVQAVKKRRVTSQQKGNGSEMRTAHVSLPKCSNLRPMATTSGSAAFSSSAQRCC